MSQLGKRADSNHRGSLDIIADILDVSESRVKKTYLMYRCNLSFRQLKHYLDFLLNKELLCEVEQEGNSVRGVFEVTDKGKRYLKVYKSLVSLMS